MPVSAVTARGDLGFLEKGVHMYKGVCGGGGRGGGVSLC